MKQGGYNLLELWIVRHGETEWNVNGRIQGWQDIALTSLGSEQAKQLAIILEGIPFRAIYSSDLKRAYDTAQYLAAHHPLSVIVEPLLRERCFGDGEGMERETMLQKFPRDIPNAESPNQVSNRAIQFLNIIAHQYTHGRILSVSHGGFIRTLLKSVGYSPVPRIHNTSVTCLRMKNRVWHVHSLNRHEHLHPSLQSTSTFHADDPHPLDSMIHC